MTNDLIEKFIETGKRKNQQVNIHFKTRSTITGMFIHTDDYVELKSKNFWRIVTRTHFDAYNQTKNAGLAKIFCGTEFQRLTPHAEAFEEEA